MGELGELFGSIIIISAILALLNYPVKLINRLYIVKQPKNIESADHLFAYHAVPRTKSSFLRHSSHNCFDHPPDYSD